MTDKSCRTCVNVMRWGGAWSCENCSGLVGMPVDVTPPNDEACANWSNNPADQNAPIDSLRDFVDHFWDDIDDWDD